MSLLSSLGFFPRGVAYSPHPQFTSSPWMFKSIYWVEISELLYTTTDWQVSFFANSTSTMCDRYPMTWSETAQGSKGNSQTAWTVDSQLWKCDHSSIFQRNFGHGSNGHVQYSSISSRKRDSVFFIRVRSYLRIRIFFPIPFSSHISPWI